MFPARYEMKIQVQYKVNLSYSVNANGGDQEE